MQSQSRCLGRRMVSVCCLAVLAGAIYGCAGKDADTVKPANGEYYTGAMEKKPAPAAGANGTGKMGIPTAPGKPQ